MHRFISEPYRIFFPLAICAGAFGVGHWMFYAFGWISGFSGTFHAAIQMQIYMNCFVFGFLMTALPRMTGTPHASATEVISFLILMSGIAGFHYVGRPVSALYFYLGTLIAFAGFAGRRLLKAKKKTSAAPAVRPPVEFVWIPVALTTGMAGAILQLAGYGVEGWRPFLVSGKAMVNQGFLLAIVLGVGGFLGPRLMGTHKVERLELDPQKRMMQESRRRYYLQENVLLGLLFLGTFVFESWKDGIPAYGVRAFIVSRVFLRTGCLVWKPVNTDAFVQLLWFSFWMVFAGSWGAVVYPAGRLPMLHLVFLGGYSLMTFAVATMVILSHAGAAEKLRKPSRILEFVFGGILLAMAFCVASPFMPERYFQLLAASAVVWLAASVLWICYVAPYLFRFPDPEQVERMHEAAKARLLQSRNEHCGSDCGG